MKYFVAVLFACLTATVAGISTYNLEQNDWELFKVKHNKEYKTDVEENFRKRIFLENRMNILEHNKLYYEGQVSYTKALNQYSDMLNTEFSAVVNGYKHPKENKNIGATFIEPSDEIKFPSEIDWRTKGAVTEVKNQGQCGSCWAFSAVGSLESRHFLKTGKLVSLSEQNLVDCSKNNSGCGGGNMDYAFNYVQKNNGIDTEASYPYTAEGGNCKYNVADKGATDHGHVDLPPKNENNLMQAVALFGPISVAINANENFQNYNSGVYSDPDCPAQLDHGVLVVGYGHDDTSGYDYWIVKNSWGADWGEKGYIRMRRNFNNMCGIASDASYPLV